ncbi:MAG: inositol monophosphatase, partial [Rhodobacteraceae bacterium]
EKIIKEELTEARPTYGWLGEESDPVAGQDPTRRWIVDPLDGTTNFLHGLPHWAVSIALEHKGQIIAGVVFDACKDELFITEKGKGAWMNDRRIRVSDRHRMTESVYATGLPFAGRSDLPATLRDLAQLLPACAGVRRWGAASLDLAYVAAGRYDGFWERGLKLWDIAGGLIIAREAGALIEGIAKGTKPEESGNVICATEVQFEQFSKLIRSS